MAWEIPKTDWHGGVDADGNYVGDYFNAVDFNRIKNNLYSIYDPAGQGVLSDGAEIKALSLDMEYPVDMA